MKRSPCAAHAAASQLAAVPLPADRINSPGAHALLWDAKTLPARILIHSGLKGGFIEAAKSLPSVEEVKPTMKHSTAYLWIDGLRLALLAQKMVDQDEYEKARAISASLTLHIEKFEAAERNAVAAANRTSPSAWPE